jgi:hypothetical protein
MLSPDGKWVWDGTQWQPIAHHESLFPSWQSITVEPAAPVAQAVQAPVRMAASPTPALVQPYAFPSMPDSAPAWRREAKPTGVNWYLYFIAGVMGIVIILVVLNSVFPLWLYLPGPKPAPEPAAAQASPIPPVAHRSDFARADHFVSGVLPPQMTTLSQDLTPVSQSCNRQLTISCQNDISTARPEVKTVLSVIDQNPVPQCIAPQVAKLRADLATIDAALTAADKAYTDNQSSELAAAMSKYSRPASQLGADVAAVAATMKAQCDATVTGP